MNAIDEFIKIDQENIVESKKVLIKIHSKSISAVEECAKFLQDVADTFGQKFLYDKYEKIIKEWVGEFKLPFSEAFKLLKNSTLYNFVDVKNDSTSEAKLALERIYSTLSTAYLLLRMRRDFFLGISELLRLRYTTAISFYRLQCESFALIKLFGSEPSIAQEWHDATSETLGRQFYNKYHKRIVELIKESGFNTYYQNASGFSMHSRIMGVASGLIIGNKMKEEGKPKEAILVYNEIDDHITLFIWFTNYLRFHEEILIKLINYMSELDDTSTAKIDIKSFSDLIIEFANTLKQIKQKK